MQRKICPTCNISYPARLESCPEDGTRLETPGNQGLPWPAGKLVAHRYVILPKPIRTKSPQHTGCAVSRLTRSAACACFSPPSAAIRPRPGSFAERRDCCATFSIPTWLR